MITVFAMATRLFGDRRTGFRRVAIRKNDYLSNGRQTPVEI